MTDDGKWTHLAQAVRQNDTPEQAKAAKILFSYLMGVSKRPEGLLDATTRVDVFLMARSIARGHQPLLDIVNHIWNDTEAPTTAGHVSATLKQACEAL